MGPEGLLWHLQSSLIFLILRQTNPIYQHTSWSSHWSLYLWLSYQLPICGPLLPIRATWRRPPHPPLLDNSNYTLRRVQISELLVMQFSSSSHHFIPLHSKYYPLHRMISQQTLIWTEKSRQNLVFYSNKSPFDFHPHVSNLPAFMRSNLSHACYTPRPISDRSSNIWILIQFINSFIINFFTLIFNYIGNIRKGISIRKKY
jgi:hypothetical protein